MGMYDEVVFDAELSDFPSSCCRRFQTKSLDCCLNRYVVTKAGRLCLAGSTLIDDDPINPHRSGGGVDIDFHGDIGLVPVEGEYGEYVARFTHGTLEWVRPFDQARTALKKIDRRGG